METARTDHPSIADELATLWRGSKGIALDRIDCLRRAAAAATAGTLDLDLRAAAVADSHKLAGALGMYGLEVASRIALEIDRMILAGGLDSGATEALQARLDELTGAVEADR